MNELLKQLIQAAPTADNGERRAAEVLVQYFRTHGIEAFADIWNENRANVIARLPSSRQKPGLLLAAHLDVVPADPSQWTFEPFAGLEQNGHILGRGAVDMLGGLAAAAAALVEIAAAGLPLQGDVVLAATAGEETDSCGANRFVQSAAQSIGPLAGIILPEPTNLKILTAHRGLLWLQITTYGRSAHGSMPKQGVNAIEKMLPLLNRLFGWSIPQPPHPRLGPCTMSINQLHAGTAPNIVPDTCRLHLDIRTLPGQPQPSVIEQIQTFLEEQKARDPNFRAEISILRQCEALETPPNSPFVQTVCRAVQTSQTDVAVFTTDGPHFLPLCPDIIILGPGNPTACHKPDESVKIDDLAAARQMYVQIIRALAQ
ncbi:MAG TPA: M20 family metallopeptidase [Anaerohalosphaeraceae bacterium]|nr:M20 family metallopeptidase [Anaerohalosphaeraceae bacterium]